MLQLRNLAIFLLNLRLQRFHLCINSKELLSSRRLLIHLMVKFLDLTRMLLLQAGDVLFEACHSLYRLSELLLLGSQLVLELDEDLSCAILYVGFLALQTSHFLVLFPRQFGTLHASLLLVHAHRFDLFRELLDLLLIVCGFFLELLLLFINLLL